MKKMSIALLGLTMFTATAFAQTTPHQAKQTKPVLQLSKKSEAQKEVKTEKPSATPKAAVAPVTDTKKADTKTAPKKH